MLKRKVPFHFQKADDYACGPVCIRMVAESFEKKIDNSEYQKLVKFCMTKATNQRGTTLKKMKEALENIGLIAQPISKEIKNKNNQKKLKSAIKKDYPVILKYRVYIENEDDKYDHYSVLVGIDEKFLWVNDPYPYKNRGRAKSPRRINIKTFEKSYLSCKDCRDKTLDKQSNWGINKKGIIVKQYVNNHSGK